MGREVSVECLYPAGDFSSEDRNEESLVLSVAYGGFSMLLTGDVGISGEEQMIEEGEGDLDFYQSGLGLYYLALGRGWQTPSNK